jgi:hypothetical protein
MISFARSDKNQVVERFREFAKARVAAGQIPAKLAAELVSQYETDINRYTYLE